ncbi:universal stress protein [Agrococcus sp. SL85]|uniref:universal stress protein n=1 Tax=Agrococcus sp. SL85 TaxID=2995141 RepID=UPI00226CFB16|nr:universal stress protein [Agrococcus sp. SL85]WAC66921.1 universal stress protein [Agrococcus sp. SL85]
MVEHVVVGVDGSTAADAALDWAMERARGVDTRLELLSVVDIDWIPQTGPDPVEAAHERVLQEALRRVETSGVDVDASTTLRHDRPVPGLVAASRRADLLVIGSHKSSAVGFVHGTLPLAVAARSRCPLAVVPVDWEPSAGPVLVGLDEESGGAALDRAATEAERLDADLLAVRAWSVPLLVSGAWASFEAPLEAFQSAEAASMDRMVASLGDRLDGLEVHAVLEHGRPSIVLAEHAARARLAVVGTHGRGVVAGILLGSVSHDLLMNLPCPVLVVPPPAAPGREGSIERRGGRED